MCGSIQALLKTPQGTNYKVLTDHITVNGYAVFFVSYVVYLQYVVEGIGKTNVSKCQALHPW